MRASVFTICHPKIVFALLTIRGATHARHIYISIIIFSTPRGSVRGQCTWNGGAENELAFSISSMKFGPIKIGREQEIKTYKFFLSTGGVRPVRACVRFARRFLLYNQSVISCTVLPACLLLCCPVLFSLFSFALLYITSCSFIFSVFVWGVFLQYLVACDLYSFLPRSTRCTYTFFPNTVQYRNERKTSVSHRVPASRIEP